MHAGAIEKQRLALFCSSSQEKCIWCLFPSSKTWFGETNCFLQHEKSDKRGTAFFLAYPTAVHQAPVLGTPKHLSALEAA